MVPKLTTSTKRLKQRDYFKKPYVAPVSIRQLSRAYRTHTTTPWWRRWWLWTLLIALLVLTGTLCIPIFTIKNIILPFIPSPTIKNEVMGLITQNLQDKKYGILPQNNLFFFSSHQLYQALAQQYSTREIKIERHWPNVLKIYLGNSLGTLEWRINERGYLVDNRGIITREMPPDWSAQIALIKIIDQSKHPNFNKTIGERAITEQEVSYFKRVYNAWLLQFSDLALQHIIYNADSASRLDLVSQAGWYIKLTTQEDPAWQLAIAARVWREKRGSADLNDLEYIDVRYGSRVYIKPKEAKN